MKKASRLSFSLWIPALLGSLAALGAACGSNSETGTSSGGPGCTPGAQSNCGCPGGGMGVQVCASDGRSFGACDCSGATGGTGGSGGGPDLTKCGDGVKDTDLGEQCDDGNEIQDDGCTNACTTPVCGDAIVQAGEDCDDGDKEINDMCPSDCNDGSGGSGGDPCAGHVTYNDLIEGEGPVWVEGADMGYQAGNKKCQMLGGDHVCDYEEVKAALAAGELDGEPAITAAGITAWVHRTTPEMVNGQMSMPGPGGRCNDWLYATNHISDGEFVTLTKPAASVVAEFSLDNDTIYDGVDTSHQQPGLLECGGVTRAILCCYPKCVSP